LVQTKNFYLFAKRAKLATGKSQWVEQSKSSACVIFATDYIINTSISNSLDTAYKSVEKKFVKNRIW